MKELTKKNYICTKEGKIDKNSIGWSRATYNNCEIKNGYFRKKTWNHYMWMSENFICAFAIVKLDYAGLIFIDFYDMKNNKEEHKTIKVPLSSGITINSKVGSYAHFKSKNTYINIIRVEDYLDVNLQWEDININASIYLEEESLNVLIPWSEKHFHYTSKQLPLKSKGFISVGEFKYDLDDSYGFIDYGRGIWEREKKWYWLTCGFEYKNKDIGLNLGALWTDNTGLNENCIKIDGKVHKIKDDVKFEKIEENKFEIKSIGSDNINLIFENTHVNDKINNSILVKSSLKQHIGRLSGIVKIEDEVINIDKSLCWCEDHYAKW